jgi:hypothetical protein
MDRRKVLIGAAAAALAVQTAAAQTTTGLGFDYLFVRLKPGGGRPAFLSHLGGPARAAVRAIGGEIIGVFTPQLGWDSNELAVLIRWSEGLGQPRDAAIAGIGAAPQVAGFERHALGSTVRPRLEDQLKPGGIYVHRWFEIRSADREEFVRLSAEGWIDFERRFATNIFGLLAETAPRAPTLKLLLLTRYADHGVWEASRDPTTDAMKSFQRRAQLTLSSRGCSTLLAGLPA